MKLRALVFSAVVLLTCPGWLAERRLTRHSLDILSRRVEAVMEDTGDKEIEESCRKCLYHLDALRGRFGKVGADDQIVLDSKDEQRVILQAMGLAGIREARAGFWREKWNAVRRWAWKKVTSFLWQSLPWGVIAVYLWFKLRRRSVEVVAYDRDVEKLPREERQEVFTHPLVQRAHARIKKRLT